jgi:hypothetical protein
MYRASIKFEGKWITCPPSETIEGALEYVKRARIKCTSRNLACNIFTETSWVPAE